MSILSQWWCSTSWLVGLVGFGMGCEPSTPEGGADTSATVDTLQYLPDGWAERAPGLSFAELLWRFAAEPRLPGSVRVEGGDFTVIAGDAVVSLGSETDGDNVLGHIVLGIDARGKEVWRTEVPARTNALKSMVADSNGEVVLFAEVFNSRGEFIETRLIRFGRDGEILWDNFYGTLAGDTSRYGDIRTPAPTMDALGDVYFVIGMTLMSVDRHGVVRWARVMEGVPPLLVPCDATYAGTWRVAIQGERLWISSQPCGLFAFSLDGEKLVARSLAASEADFVPTPRGTLLLIEYSEEVGRRRPVELDASGATIRAWDDLFEFPLFFDAAGYAYGALEQKLARLDDGKVTSWAIAYDQLRPYAGGRFFEDAAWIDRSGKIVMLSGVPYIFHVISPEGERMSSTVMGNRPTAQPRRMFMLHEGEVIIASQPTHSGAPPSSYLDCYRVPVGLPAEGTWSVSPTDFRGARFVSAP